MEEGGGETRKGGRETRGKTRTEGGRRQRRGRKREREGEREQRTLMIAGINAGERKEEEEAREGEGKK